MRHLATVLVVGGAALCANTACAEVGERTGKILLQDGESGDNFGRAVAVSGNTAIVGMPGDADNGLSSGG